MVIGERYGIRVAEVISPNERLSNGLVKGCRYEKVSAIALVCGVWLSGSVAFAGSAADWIDAEVQRIRTLKLCK